jgi:hypothetical protein
MHVPPTAAGAPSSNRFRAHLVTWAIIVFIVAFRVIAHCFASTDTSFGRVIRTCFRAGDPKGPNTGGFGHEFFIALVILSTAWTLAHRYGRTLVPGLVIMITVALFYAFTLTLFPNVIAAAHPNLPTLAVWRALPTLIFVAGAGCLMGAGVAINMDPPER